MSGWLDLVFADGFLNVLNVLEIDAVVFQVFILRGLVGHQSATTTGPTIPKICCYASQRSFCGAGSRSRQTDRRSCFNRRSSAAAVARDRSIAGTPGVSHRKTPSDAERVPPPPLRRGYDAQLCDGNS